MATAIEDLEKKPAGRKQAGTLTENQPSSVQSIASGLPGAAYSQIAKEDITNAYSKGGLGAAIGQGVRSAIGGPFAAATDIAKTMDAGIEGVGRLLDPAATALRTAVTGDPTPIRKVMAEQQANASPALAATAQSTLTTAAPPPVAAPTASQSTQPVKAQMPSGIGDLPPGTGMIQNNSTGKVMAVGSPQQPAVSGEHQGSQPAVQRIAAPSPARAATDKALAEYNRLMFETSGGVGAGLVAKMMSNRAKDFSRIDASQDQSGTARMNSGIAAQEAVSRDAERQSIAGDRTRRAEQEQKVNAVRDQYAALDDVTDPDGKQRQALKSKLEILSGAGGDLYQAIMGKDEYGNPTAIGVLNRRSGRITDPSGSPVQSPAQRAHVDAQRAIAAGKISREDANKRLIAAGFPEMSAIGTPDRQLGQLSNRVGSPLQSARQLPSGMKQIGTSNGVPVYEDANGNRFTN